MQKGSVIDLTAGFVMNGSKILFSWAISKTWQKVMLWYVV
jgi:hypothetical protein